MQEEAFATLIEVLEDPERGRRQLPKLVGMLDAADPQIRTGAAWAITHVGRERPDTVAYLARRLGARLESEDPTTALALTFAFLAHDYPERVGDELDAMAAEADEQTTFRSIEGTLSRANYPMPALGNRDVGRTRFPSGDTPGASTGVYTRREEPDERPRPVGEEAEATDDSDLAGDTEEGEGSPDDGEDGVATGGGRPRQWEPADQLPTVVYRSRFEQLTVLTRVGRERYADIYRTLGVIDEGELAVGFAIYELPDERPEAFVQAIVDRLDDWSAVDDHENVVTVHDHGPAPRPWSAVEFTEQRLTDRDRLEGAEAVWNARRLAAGLQHVHERGVVHAGLDPYNVVYYGNQLDGADRQPPMLTNVALMSAIRRHFDPTDRLDPRYAAPEYFDRRYGRIDHATDIYQLGAVLYRLFTGRHPYEGPYERIREAVLSEASPRPSHAVDVPRGVDDVVTKAMAREKLRRYETVSNMASDLRSIGGNQDG